MEALFCIYFVVTCAITLVGGLIVSFETEYEENILKIAFYPQIELWKSLRDEVNVFGICILILITSVFLLPLNFLMIILQFLKILLRLLWKGFLLIFRKKKEER